MMVAFRDLLRRVSILRVFVFILLWTSLAFAYFSANVPQIDGADHADIADPPAVTQLAYPSSSLRGVEYPPPTTPDTIRIAWVSASPAFYGNIYDPHSPDEPPGFIQDPVARALAGRLKRPVAVDAYATIDSRVLEKFLVAYHALEAKPDAIVISFIHWDFSDRAIALPHFQNYHIGIMTKHPLAMFQSSSLWPFLHLEEIGWADTTVLLPILRYRREIKARIETWSLFLDPSARTPAAPEPVSTTHAYEGISFLPADYDDLRPRLVGNEAILDSLLDMIRASGIPAFVYADPTEGLDDMRGLEAALARYRERLPPGARLAIEPRSLNRFLDGIVFRNRNHLKAPAPVMTEYLTNQILAILSEGRR